MCSCQREYPTGYSQSWSLCLSPPDWSLIHTELKSRSEKVSTCGFFAKAAPTTLKHRTNMTLMTLTRPELHRVKSLSTPPVSENWQSLLEVKRLWQHQTTQAFRSALDIPWPAWLTLFICIKWSVCFPNWQTSWVYLTPIKPVMQSIYKQSEDCPKP